MSVLFGRGSFQDRAQFIFKATKQHSLNLFKFASLYKFITILLRRNRGGKVEGIDSFIGGIVGGWVVFRERNAVNEQVSMRMRMRSW